MKHANRWFVTLALAGLTLDAGAVAAADAPTESATWQHHHATFNYVGFTSAYTCDGLEAQVRTILAYFGARKQGMDVEAQGCPRGPNSLSHTALVTIDFDTLGAAPADAPAGSLVQARWTAFKVTTQRPFFIGQGDCELIYSIKPILTQYFSFRDLAYDTSCTPHDVTLLDFRIAGEVLKSAS
jgi:hypothetical protein